MAKNEIIIAGCFYPQITTEERKEDKILANDFLCCIIG
jgi:hypothetical protein